MPCSFMPTSDSQVVALLHVVSDAVYEARSAYRDAEVRVLAAKDPDSQEDAVIDAQDAEHLLRKVCDLANEVGVQFDNWYLIALAKEATDEIVVR